MVVGTEFAGHRLEEVIGHGGMGVVYRARDLELDRVVALKVIAPEYAQDRDFRERFKRESQLAASIKHPNVISIYRAGAEGDQLYITMDYVEGSDLHGVIAVRGRLNPKVAADIVAQVADGLDAAHARGLVHRDVKPANVLVEDHRGRQQAYLTDFGLTKLATPASALTKTGLIVGTTDYLAPEQIEGRPIDARVDVYALGCVLYEALTGSVPYPRDNNAAKIWAHMSEPVPSVLESGPDIPTEFDAVVRRAMAKDPNHRFLSADEMGRAVTAAAAGSAAEAGGAAAVAPMTGGAPPGGGGSVPTPPPSQQGKAATRRVKRKRRVVGEDGASAPPVTAAGRPTAPASADTEDKAAAVAQRPAPTRGAAPPPPPVAPGPASAGADAAGSPPRRVPNSRVLLALGAAAVVAVVVAVVLVLGGDDSKDQSAVTSEPVVARPLPAGLAWRELRNAPIARQYAGATAVDGSVWVFGGLGVNTSSTTAKAYDPVINEWKTGPGLPLPLHHVTAVTYKGDAVVIGGFVPNGSDLTAETSDRVFALRDGAWQELPKLNHARAAAGAGVVGDKIVVVGGQAGGKLVPQTEVFDGDSWKDVADIPTPREHLGAASDGRYVYAVGGRNLASDKNSPALERYDPGSDSWTKLPDMPTASGSVAAAVVGGRLITVGGETPTQVSAAVQAYDVTKKRWSTLPPMHTARHGVALAAIGDSLYAIGGATAPGHVGSTRKAEVLDLSKAPAKAPSQSAGRWRELRNAPFARQYAAATAVQGAVWVFGGLGVTTSSTTAKAYDPVINEWKTGPGLPLPLHHVTAVTYKGDPVVIGGFVPKGSELTAETSNRVFALRNGAWEELPKLNHARAAAGAGVVGDKIVVVGGQAGGKLVPQTEVFDGDSWKDVADIPTPREHLGAASDGRYVYAVGGRNLASDKNSPALERYDPGSDRWTKLPDMPTASGSVGAAVVNGRLITVGGETPTEVSDAVQAFDLTKQTWSLLPRMHTARHGVAVAALGDSLYAIGGATAPGHVGSTRKAEVLELR